jgi:hypothetical protein
MDRHDVGASEQLVHLDQLDAVVGRLLRGDERVDTQDGHLHGPGADRDGLPDLADADDAERPAAQLAAREGRALPLAPTDRGVGWRRLARQAVEERKGVFRGAMVLPAGALTTVMPARRGVGSTLSTPTPARPMTTGGCRRR